MSNDKAQMSNQAQNPKQCQMTKFKTQMRRRSSFDICVCSGLLLCQRLLRPDESGFIGAPRNDTRRLAKKGWWPRVSPGSPPGLAHGEFGNYEKLCAITLGGM